MKTRKLLHRIGDVLSGEARKKDMEKSSLRKLLRSLEKKEEELRERLENETDEHRAAKLRKKIKLLHAQRKKGREALDACG